MTVIGKETKVGQEAEIYQMVNGVETKVLGFDPTTGLAKDVSGRALGRAQDVLDAMGDNAGYYCSTGQYISSAVSSALAIGSSPMTILLTFKTDTASVASSKSLAYLYNSASNYAAVTYDVTGKFGFLQGDGSTVTTVGTSAVPVGKWASVACVRDATPSQRIYVNGTLDKSDTQVNKNVGAGGNCAAYVGDGSTPNGTTFGRALFFNYALSDDKVRKYSMGAKLDFEDIGGAMTALATGGWTNQPTYPFTGFSSADKTTFAGTTAGALTIATKNHNFVAGKRYRLQVASITSTPRRIMLSNTANSDLELIQAYTTSSSIDLTFTPTVAATVLRFDFNTGSVSVTLTGIQLDQLGCVLDLEPESATPTVWHDESGNNLDGIVTGATLVDTPQFAQTDYGRAAVIQEVVDNAVGSSYRFNGSSSYIKVETSPAVAGSYPGTTLVVAKCDSVSAGYHSFFAFAGTSGTPYFTRYGSNIGAYPNAMVAVPDIVSPHVYVTTHDGVSTQKLYVDGVYAKTGTIAVAPISSALIIGGVAPGGELFDGSIYRAIQFNYVLSEDKIRKYSAGSKLDYEDVGGSMTPMTFSGSFVNNGSGFESGFSGTANSWTGVNSAGSGWTVNGGLTLVAGKLYTVTVTLTLQAGQTVEIYLTNGSWVDSSDHVTIAASGTYSVNLKCTTDQSNGYVNMYVSGTSASAVSGTSISIRRAGAVLDLEPENITDTVWVDASPYGLHGAVSGAVANRFVPSYSSRNYIINGGFDFFQRGSPAAGSGSAKQYLCDRFHGFFNGGTGAYSVVQSTDVPDASLAYSARVQRDSGVTNVSGLYFVTAIESRDCQLLQGKQVTLSFWAKTGSGFTANPAGILVAVTTGTGVDENPATTYTGAAVPLSTFVPLTTTWTRFSFTFPIAVGVKEMKLSIRATHVGTAPADDSYLIAGVMLNEGNVAAPFARAGGTIAGELAACQRYYEKSYPVGTAPGNTSSQGVEVFYSRSADALTRYPVRFRVTKRVAPTTLTNYAAVSGTPNMWRNVTASSDLAASTTNIGDCGFTSYPTSSTSATAEYQFHWTADAEL
jgi:hypothetical protein